MSKRIQSFHKSSRRVVNFFKLTEDAFPITPVASCRADFKTTISRAIFYFYSHLFFRAIFNPSTDTMQSHLSKLSRKKVRCLVAIPCSKAGCERLYRALWKIKIKFVVMLEENWKKNCSSLEHVRYLALEKSCKSKHEVLGTVCETIGFVIGSQIFSLARGKKEE